MLVYATQYILYVTVWADEEQKYNKTSMVHAMEDGRTIKQTYGS